MKTECKYFIDFKNWGGCQVSLMDLNQDGKNELVVYQGPTQLRTPWVAEYLGMTEENRNFQCVTAVTLNGEIMWQIGKPWSRQEPFRSHSGIFNVGADFLGNGTVQVLSLDLDKLILRDPLDGSVIKERPVPHDYLDTLWLFYPNGTSPCVLVKPTDYPRGYNLFLDSDLQDLWPSRIVWGTGHRVAISDIDGDGFDEMLNGYELIDHDGSIIWAIDFPDHADFEYFADIDEDGKDEIIMPGGEDEGILIDLDGTIRWKVKMDHCQSACSGKFLADKNGLQTIFFEKEKHLTVMVDSQGEDIRRQGIHARGQTLSWETDTGPQAILMQRNMVTDADKKGNYKPVIMDGNLKEIAELDVPDLDLEGAKRKFPTPIADFGCGYNGLINDVDGDGKEEVLIISRKGCWIFGVS